MIKLKRILCGALCIIIILSTILIYINAKNITSEQREQTQALTLWNIENFEGGTGSRSTYLQNKANNYKKQGGTYVNVISLSSSAAKSNLKNNNIPDIISFGSGESGLEGAINTTYKINCWCYGSYCLLSSDTNADFSQAATENTVINEGKGNLWEVAALFCNLYGAKTQKSTYAYVELISGKYKFLLGTQRDIYRLNARKVNYSVMPLTQFNDLYQLIAVCTKENERAELSYNFITYLLNNNNDIYNLGLLGGDTKVNEKIAVLEDKKYDYTLKTPLTAITKKQIQDAVSIKDINKLKTLLK